MRKLHIADGLSLPVDAATQTFAFIARKGAGKTYTAGKLCELLLGQHVQVVIIDTVGNWYGLRLAADGKGRGYDIPVIGGLRGDIPLEASGGELIADIVVDTGRSLILDCSQFSLTDRKRFATAFGHRLWQRKKGQSRPTPLMLVIEESQLIIPERVDSGSAAMVGIYEEIIRLGRNYGIGVAMISQRPQSVNKEVLNQTECLFVGQVNGYQERDALKKWVTYQGMDKNLVDELPGLSVGTMYVWSPQWLNVLKKVKILPKTTYDASATPKVGRRRVARSLKPLNLDDLQAKMAATIQRAKADDPAELRKKIAELNRQIAAKHKPTHVVASQTDIQKAVERAVKDRDKQHDRIASQLRHELNVLVTSIAAIGDICSKVNATAKRVKVDLTPVPFKYVKLPVPVRMPAGKAYPSPSDLNLRVQSLSSAQERKAATDGKLRAGAERMLAALVQWHPNGMLEGQMRSHAGMKKGGTFNTYKSDLRKGGYIEQRDGQVYATQLGIDYFGGNVPDTPTTTEGVLSVWRPKLREGARRMLDILVGQGGDPMVRMELAEAAGMSKGGTFNTYLSDLRTARLIITGKGTVAANKDTLFL